MGGRAYLGGRPIQHDQLAVAFGGLVWTTPLYRDGDDGRVVVITVW